jgi:hypothetical protein
VNGEDVFRALIAARVPQLVQELTATEKGALAIAVMGASYRGLPRRVKEACEDVARELDS